VIHEESAPDGRTSPGENMPLIYRSMKREVDGLPKVGQSGTTLGVRIPGDIVVDQAGCVSPGTVGMSVSPDWRSLPPFLVPARLRHLCPKARGRDDIYCWKMGEGEFVDGPLTSALNFRRDTATHGLVEPAAIVPLGTYEADLAATRDHWIIDET
jgi:hypothetical protein